MRNTALALALAALAAAPLAAQGTSSGWNAPRARGAASALSGGSDAVIDLHGPVSVQGADEQAPRRVDRVPFALKPGDELRTGADAGATVQLKDMSQVRLGARADFTLQEDQPKRVSLFLGLGKLWAEVSKDAGRAFEVRTPVAVAAVRGTRFSVEAASPKVAVTEVFEGAVAVQGLKAGAPAGPEAVLLPGQHVEVDGGVVGKLRTMIKPVVSSGQTASRDQAAARLKKMLAQAELQNEPDKARAIKQALDSGSQARMERTADAIGYFGGLTEGQRAALEKGFDKTQTLAELRAGDMPDVSRPEPPSAAPEPAPRPQVAAERAGATASKWSVNREIGLQLQQDSFHAAVARSAVSPGASPASAQVLSAAYGQQATQAYLRSAAGGAAVMPPSAGVGVAAPPTALSPDLPGSNVSPFTSNPAYQPAAFTTQPPTTSGGGTITCTTTVCN